MLKSKIIDTLSSYQKKQCSSSREPEYVPGSAESSVESMLYKLKKTMVSDTVKELIFIFDNNPTPVAILKATLYLVDLQDESTREERLGAMLVEVSRDLMSELSDVIDSNKEYEENDEFKAFIGEGIEKGLVVECCSGCGTPMTPMGARVMRVQCRDCGCPAGTSYKYNPDASNYALHRIK